MQSWVVGGSADNDLRIDQFEELLNWVVLAEITLMAIQVKRLSGPMVKNVGDTNTLVVPELVSFM